MVKNYHQNICELKHSLKHKKSQKKKVIRILNKRPKD